MVVQSADAKEPLPQLAVHVAHVVAPAFAAYVPAAHGVHGVAQSRWIDARMRLMAHVDSVRTELEVQRHSIRAGRASPSGNVARRTAPPGAALSGLIESAIDNQPPTGHLY